MTVLILALLKSETDLLTEMLKSQTAEQQKLLWDRHIARTQPLYDLIIKIESKIGGVTQHSE